MDSSLCSSSTQAEIEADFLRPDLKTCAPQTFLQEIRKVVSKHHRSEIKLKKKGKEYTFRVGSFEETHYSDIPDILDEWQEFYLPDHMFMEVIGALQRSEYPEEELVLMVCEDGKVFADEDHYDDELHVVAENLEELFTSGLKFPSPERYYNGQRFEDMTQEEWDKMEQSEILRKKREEARKETEEFRKLLDRIRIHKESHAAMEKEPNPVSPH